MKKIILHILLVSVVLLSSSAIQEKTNECDIRLLKNELIKTLKPNFKYDSSKATHFLFTDREQIIEIAAPLFKGENFRFLFNTAGLPKNIEIRFYDKKQGSKNRKRLFSLEEVRKEGKHIYAYDPKISKKIYLNYIIPRTRKQNLSGCMVCVIGYNFK